MRINKSSIFFLANFLFRTPCIGFSVKYFVTFATFNILPVLKKLMRNMNLP